MKKYLFAVIFSIFSLSQAFSIIGASIQGRFIGEGKVIFQPVKGGRSYSMGPILPRMYVDPGIYDISISNEKGGCNLTISNFNVEGGRTYTATSSPNKEACGIQEGALEPISKP